MHRTQIRDLFREVTNYIDSEITICGWARTIRDSKSLGFIELNDGTCFQNLQVVMETAKVENYKEIVKQNVGCALQV